MYLELKQPGEAPIAPPPTLDPWRQLLLEAAVLIERKGWCQKHLMDVKGRMCTIGAMTSVWDLESDWNMDVISLAQDKLTAVVGPLVEWNDTDGRTKAEVVEVLRYVATRV